MAFFTDGILFAARGLQGAFAAVMAPAALSLLAVTFTHGKDRATARAQQHGSEL